MTAVPQLSAYQQDALREILNVGAGRTVRILNDMIGVDVELEIPRVERLVAEEGLTRGWSPTRVTSVVSMGFGSQIEGVAMLMLAPTSAEQLTRIATHGHFSDDEMVIIVGETMLEVGNVFINTVLGSMANYLDLVIDFDLPHYWEQSLTHVLGALAIDRDLPMVSASVSFACETERIEGQLVLYFPRPSLAQLQGELERLIKAVDSVA